MDTHNRYLEKAGIPYTDAQNRRADFHVLRHTYGSLLAKAGIAPRVAMSLMRHTDVRLTMNVYMDSRVFDLAGAVQKLPPLFVYESEVQAAGATGTDGVSVGAGGSTRRSESVSSRLTLLGGVRRPLTRTPQGKDRR
jgi:hypothetical protein